MKTNSLILIFLFSFTFSFAQTQTKTVDTVTVKYKLCEYLLSCQSMAYTIRGEKNKQMKNYLATKGNYYYNQAYNEFIKLQDPKYGELNKDLREGVAILLQTYSKIYSNISILDDISYSIALAHIDNIFKRTILPGLWNK